MSSILTNNGAMVALQTLRSINKNLEGTQNSIATGKDVATSKDNAAVWAISKVMESDVAGFKAISDNLGLGQATTQVARQAAETTTDLLKNMKEKIVAAQEQNVDRAKIQTDIESLRDQINSVTGAAQFNGLNLLSNGSFTAGEGTVSVLSSLDRSGDGVVSSNISVEKQDLRTTSTAATAGATWATAGTAFTGADGATAAVVAFSGGDVQAGFAVRIDAVNGSAVTAAGFDAIVVAAQDGDTLQSFTDRVMTAMQFSADRQGVDVTFSRNATAGTIDATNNTGAAAAFATTDVSTTTLDEDTDTIGGGLELLNSFDVTTDEGAAAALGAIESLIQTSIDSAAAFGSSQKRIETQQDFVSGLMDAMKSGIGTLVDADMEEQSARLQALQVQQQLGVQALSIANQAPQQLLSLFR